VAVLGKLLSVQLDFLAVQHIVVEQCLLFILNHAGAELMSHCPGRRAQVGWSLWLLASVARQLLCSLCWLSSCSAGQALGSWHMVAAYKSFAQMYKVTALKACKQAHHVMKGRYVLLLCTTCAHNACIGIGSSLSSACLETIVSVGFGTMCCLVFCNPLRLVFILKLCSCLQAGMADCSGIPKACDTPSQGLTLTASNRLHGLLHITIHHAC
jgi:hypothetical protein